MSSSSIVTSSLRLHDSQTFDILPAISPPAREKIVEIDPTIAFASVLHLLPGPRLAASFLNVQPSLSQLQR